MDPIRRRSIIYLLLTLIFVGVFFLKISLTKKPIENQSLLTEKAQKRSFHVDVNTIGELEAARSTIISSSIRGDLGKIIYLIKDGANVKEQDLLVKMDPTPFEEKIEELEAKIKEQEMLVKAYEQLLEAEQSAAEHEFKIAAFEAESAQLELNKIINGDGPIEVSRLQSVLQKARIKYEELEGYSNDLLELEKKGYLNTVEFKQAQKKLQEEKEAYEVASKQYNSFVEHVQPMQIKKAEASLKRAILNQEEKIKSGGYKIGKAIATLEQASQEMESMHLQLKSAQEELKLTEIKAPSPGMVVLREDYRSGQRRKPRVGDILVKNQPLLDLPDLASMAVKTKVREIDLYKIGIGKPVTIEVDAYPDLRFTGKVQWIGVLALADSGRGSEEKYFEVKIEMDNADGHLRPGMTARTIIHAAKVENQITVPLHAIFEDQKKNYCYVQTKRSIELRPVEIGMSNEQWVEVRSGLKENETVCLTLPEKEKNASK